MGPSVRLSLAGFLATAVAFGPARMGYGLFLPAFREDFALSTERAGFIASAAFAAFLVGLPVAAHLTERRGPKLTVTAGGGLACLGMGLVALSPNAGLLALGVALAAASAGLSWAPYNIAAQRVVPDPLVGRALSVVSTGTTFGIAGAGALALAVSAFGLHWRLTWTLFAAAGLAAALVNMAALPAAAAVGSAGDRRRDWGWRLRSLAHAEALPLAAVALSFGVTNAIYLSFAVDRIASAGGLQIFVPDASGPILFMVFGAGGVIGLLTGDIEKRLGIATLLRAIFLASCISLALIGLAPDHWLAALVSAALQGGCLMTISAVFSFWSLRMFPNLPSVSFTAVLVVFAGGNVAGPALAGVAAGQVGLGATFLAAGGVSLVTALLLPRRVRRETPAAG